MVLVLCRSFTGDHYIIQIGCSVVKVAQHGVHDLLGNSWLQKPVWYICTNLYGCWYRAIWNFLYPPLSEDMRLRGQFWRRFFHHLVYWKFLQSLVEDSGDPASRRLNLWRNRRRFVFGWTSFFIWTVGAAHSLKSVFDRIPACSSLSNSLLICSRAAKGTFHFFLNTGCAPPFTFSLAFSLEHFPRPPEKTWGNRCLSSLLRLSELDVVLSILRQTVLIGQSHRLIFFYPVCSEQVVRIFCT